MFHNWSLLRKYLLRWPKHIDAKVTLNGLLFVNMWILFIYLLGFHITRSVNSFCRWLSTNSKLIMMSRTSICHLKTFYLKKKRRRRRRNLPPKNIGCILILFNLPAWDPHFPGAALSGWFLQTNCILWRVFV